MSRRHIAYFIYRYSAFRDADKEDDGRPFTYL